MQDQRGRDGNVDSHRMIDAPLEILPTGQKPVKATLMDTSPVAVTPRRTHSGFISSAIAVLATNSTIPAISQTIRSIYQRSVGTI